jgi:GH15 family glucan-1,4-alpha-glucosidase
MCWVALDRAIRLADKRSFPAPRDRWLRVRDEIYEDILLKGWSEKRQAFVQYYGSESLDAANLMMALTFFMSPTDPRMLATLDATLLPLDKGGLTANSGLPMIHGRRWTQDWAPAKVKDRDPTPEESRSKSWHREALQRCVRAAQHLKTPRPSTRSSSTCRPP